MRSYRVIGQDINRMLEMLEKGRLLSRKQAAQHFNCSEKTITSWIKVLKELGHQVHYSRSLKKYLLKNRRK